MKNDVAQESTYQVILFYKYTQVADPEALAAWVKERAQAHTLMGRALIAEEGINATFEGLVADTEAFVSEFLQDARFADVLIKRSIGDGAAFPKLSVKVRDEIVGTRFPKELADPAKKTAPRMTPSELKQKLEAGEDLVIIDMRNDYEFKSGHFKGSVNPGLEASRDLPDVLPNLEQYKDKKVLTVCTGGIRCEKMSAFLMNSGFNDVSQLENGIHGYMEEYPGEDFVGSLYTFDKRKTMHFGGEREIVGACYLCNEKTEEYTNCKNDLCHRHFLVCERCEQADGTPCSKECEVKVKELVVGN